MTFDHHLLPPVNALLNATAAVFLIFGWRAIKAHNRESHQRWMMTAVVCSAFFLCTYLTYHYLAQGFVTRYQGEGVLRAIYFMVLLTHTPLAALIVPFCIAAVYFAFRGNFAAHVKITRWLFPAWLYVSVTGVIIYVMLYVL